MNKENSESESESLGGTQVTTRWRPGTTILPAILAFARWAFPAVGASPVTFVIIEVESNGRKFGVQTIGVRDGGRCRSNPVRIPRLQSLGMRTG